MALLSKSPINFPERDTFTTARLREWEVIRIFEYAYKYALMSQEETRNLDKIKWKPNLLLFSVSI